MPIDPQSAIDEIYGVVKDVVDNESAAIVGYVPEVRWPGNPENVKPDPTKVWLRVSIKTVTDAQSSLASGDDGSKRYTNVSLLFVQVFAPRSLFAMQANATPVNLQSVGRELAYAIRDRFRRNDASPSGAIWYRDQKAVDAPPEPDYYPVLVTVTFQFDTIQ
jgi:hypothetical protein